MEIKVRIVKENKDGSANAMVDFDKEGLEFLVQEGILHVLEAYIKANKNAQEGRKLREKLDADKKSTGRKQSSPSKTVKKRV